MASKHDPSRRASRPVQQSRDASPDPNPRHQNGSADRSVEHSPAILLAEDNDEMRDVLAWHLRKSGYSVTECSDGAELLSHLQDYFDHASPESGAERFDLVVSDIRMPGVFGLSVVEGAEACEDFPPVILITAFGDQETHDTARRCGVLAVFDKPFDVTELVAYVRSVLSNGSERHVSSTTDDSPPAIKEISADGSTEGTFTAADAAGKSD